MAFLGKFFGAIRSVAKRMFVSRRDSAEARDASAGDGKVDAERDTPENPQDVPSVTPTPDITSPQKRTRPAGLVKKAKLIEYNGERKTVQEWAEKFKICATAIRQRLRRYGTIVPPTCHDEPIAQFKDIRLLKTENGAVIEADGKTYTLFQFAKEFGIKFSTLYGRVQKGLDIRDIINAPRSVNRDYSKAPPVKARLWEWKGEKHTIEEWAKIYGVGRNMMRLRLTKNGSPEKNTERQQRYKARRAKRFEWNGESHTAKEWAEIYHVPERTMFGRLKAHKSPEAKKRVPPRRISRLLEWNGEKHTAEEWGVLTGQTAKIVRAHFRKNGTPHASNKVNTGRFQAKTYTWKGVTKSAAEWASEYKCTINAVLKRFRKNGTPEATGQKQTAHHFTFNGESLTYKEWGARYGISADRMYMRIKRHGTPSPVEKKKEDTSRSGSDKNLYWCDGESKTITEWANELGMSRRTVKKNFDLYGTPMKPKYDCADLAQEEDYGENEEDIDAMLQDIDQKNRHTRPKESIAEWLERIKQEPDDERPLREILGVQNPRWGFCDQILASEGLEAV